MCFYSSQINSVGNMYLDLNIPNKHTICTRCSFFWIKLSAANENLNILIGIDKENAIYPIVTSCMRHMSVIQLLIIFSIVAPFGGLDFYQTDCCLDLNEWIEVDSSTICGFVYLFVTLFAMFVNKQMNVTKWNAKLLRSLHVVRSTVNMLSTLVYLKFV